ncbi:MAG TPA: AAA family ATPase [Candidatus Ozemobacteraceae bacterium]|nr:AAA family ATPase [Candidatus Ozemobacteraceae bacterium]
MRECIAKADEQEYPRRVELLSGSSIKPENIRWLWRDWLAKGKLHILGGAPGCGKTTLAMVLAATVSSGGQWPDGSLCERGNVVIWTGEDDPADTLIPRLILSGADLSRVHFINSVVDGEERRAFDPAHDVMLLAQTLRKAGNVRLLIVDPIVSAVAGDSHKNAEVRRGLQGLVDLSREVGCALVGITHLSKGTQGREPLERITGSLAFGALTRIAWVAVKPQPEEDGRMPSRLFLRVKSNMGPDGGGFEYELLQGETETGVRSSYALWGKAIDGDARTILSEAESVDDDGEGGALSHAKTFLRELLGNGPLVAKVIEKEAKEAGYSWSTIRRAQSALGIRPAKDAFNGPWKWSLPKLLKDTEDAHTKNVSIFDNFERLREKSAVGQPNPVAPERVEVEV